jgi:tRNA dimethylallyltransferase
MDIGTAKVTAAERRRVPHHGLDLADPDERFTAADFLRHALDALRSMAGRAPLAVLVGGTGLYLRTVARGMPVDETGHNATLRADLEARLAAAGLPPLIAQLRYVAPTVAHSTDLANPRRVVRALERALLMGDQLPPEPRGYSAPVAWIGLDAETATHDGWIEARVREQFESGLLDEAASLLARYDPGLPPFSAFGYREAFAVLGGRLDLDRAITQDALRTRRFARRQRTWFRAEPDVTWLAAGDPPSTRQAIEIGRRISG